MLIHEAAVAFEGSQRQKLSPALSPRVGVHSRGSRLAEWHHCRRCSAALHTFDEVELHKICLAD